jgi:hypothetical protein
LVTRHNKNIIQYKEGQSQEQTGKAALFFANNEKAKERGGKSPLILPFCPAPCRAADFAPGPAFFIFLHFFCKKGCRRDRFLL